MQATGGAALTPEPSPVRPSRRCLAIFAVLALVGYSLDQVTKAWAEHRLSGGRDIPVIDGLFTLHLVYNPGAAFGTGAGHTYLFSLLAIAATLVVLWLSRRLGSRVWAVGMGLLLAGITGNLTDRLLRAPGPLHGHVVDFLQLPNWPVFNIADICINAGAVVLIVQSLRGVHLDGTRDDAVAEDDS